MSLFNILKEIDAENLLVISSPDFIKVLTHDVNILTFFKQIYISDDALTKTFSKTSASYNIIIGSLLTPSELHDIYKLNKSTKSWHGNNCEICENINYIYNSLPNKIDLTVIDCNELRMYFDFLKVYDKLDVIFLTNPSKLFLQKIEKDFEQILKHTNYIIYKRKN